MGGGGGDTSKPEYLDWQNLKGRWRAATSHWSKQEIIARKYLAFEDIETKYLAFEGIETKYPAFSYYCQKISTHNNGPIL